jgi:hypothetical protein
MFEEIQAKEGSMPTISRTSCAICPSTGPIKARRVESVVEREVQGRCARGRRTLA